MPAVAWLYTTLALFALWDGFKEFTTAWKIVKILGLKSCSAWFLMLTYQLVDLILKIALWVRVYFKEWGASFQNVCYIMN